MARQYLYSGFLRLWHWGQAVLILGLLVTGFAVHGSHGLLDFERATDWHELLAWTLLGLWVFAWFWHLTTGEWKQYKPSPLERVLAMVRYYGIGIFKGEPHPFHKDRWHRHNPLQRMAYLSLHILIGPAIWITGLAYILYPYWNEYGFGWLSIGVVALLHTAAAFLILTFLVAHLYLALTTSEKPLAYLKGMISGYEDVEEEA